MNARKISLLFFILFYSCHLFAQANNRQSKKFGAYMSILGEPFPTFISINHAYNVMSFSRLHLGFGTTASSKTVVIGTGTKFFWPTWNFTPFVSINMARINNNNYKVSEGSKQNAFHWYTGAGFDWQSPTGFNWSIGYNYSLKDGVGGLPFGSIGIFY